VVIDPVQVGGLKQTSANTRKEVKERHFLKL